MKRSAHLAPVTLLAAVVLALPYVSGCAGGPKEAPPAAPPTVEVGSIKSIVITPEFIRFEAQIIIRNRLHETLVYDRVDYAVDLYDTEVSDLSWDGLDPGRAGGRQTVTFRFEIEMEDIAAQAVDPLAEGRLRVGFRGTVHPVASSGVGPMPFCDVLTIPIPSIPRVTFAGARGNPFGQSFRVFLDVWNPNDFLFSVHSVESYIEINDRRYDLLHTVDASNIGPNQTGTVELVMENTVGKSLSMVLNVLQSDEPEYRVGGTITARTPYGWLSIPVAVDGRAP